MVTYCFIIFMCCLVSGFSLSTTDTVALCGVAFCEIIHILQVSTGPALRAWLAPVYKDCVDLS